MTDFVHPLFRWESAGGVVIVTMDYPGRSANTMDDRFRREFSALVDHLSAAREHISGVIITSAKETFCAGGDLRELMAATPAEAPVFTAALKTFHEATRRLETLGRPVVAAINGTALGGGCELALACHHRIITDDPDVRIGLPEVTLGLIPGGGGTARSARLLGLGAALENVLLSGRPFRPGVAAEIGLVDRAIPATDLIGAARAWIAEHSGASQPWDQPGFRISGLDAATLPALPANLRKQVRGPLTPAPRAVIAATVEGSQVDIDHALQIEARYCVGLICGQISSNLIQSRFFDMQAIKSGANRPEGYPSHPARKLAVLGAGMMGAGIAHVSALAGIDVILKDVTQERAEQGKARCARLLDKAIERGRMTLGQRDEVMARIRPTTDPAESHDCDLVVEAVFENPELKQQVIAEVLPYLASGAAVASNTSTLPITGLAEGLAAPENFIGTHFFSPVDRMALVEIVIGEKTSDATLSRAIDFVQQIGKTPIVVNDSRGFFTSRVIATYMDEAVAMVGEGIPAATVEQAATQAGYPVGALALVDEVSLTLGRTIRRETSEAQRKAAREVTEHPAAAVIDRMIDEFGREGRASGAGFYDYEAGRKIRLWPGLASEFGSQPGGVPLGELQERLLFAESIEAVRCLDEGVLRSAADGNVGSLLGIGFPAWTGGVLQYIDQYAGGLAGFAQRARQLADRYGPRFIPPDSLAGPAGSEARR